MSVLELVLSLVLAGRGSVAAVLALFGNLMLATTSGGQPIRIICVVKRLNLHELHAIKCSHVVRFSDFCGISVYLFIYLI